MSAVDIASAGNFTLTRNVPTTFNTTWPGRIGPYQWCGMSAWVLEENLRTSASVTLVNQGSHYDGVETAWSAQYTITGDIDSGNLVQCHLIVMCAVDPTP